MTDHIRIRSISYRVAPVALAAIALATCARASTGDNTSLVRSSPPTAESFLTRPELRQAGFCPDLTASMNPAVIESIQRHLRSIPDLLGEGSARELEVSIDPIPAVHVVIRQIDADPMGVQNELVNVLVPGVPGLAAAPAPDDLDAFVGERAAWVEAREVVEKARLDSEQARRELQVAIDEVEFSGSGSGIVGCITSIAETFRPDSPVSVLLVSDLDQQGAPQLRGDLSLVDLRVVHDCHEDVSVCNDQMTALVDIVSAAGVVSISFSRPERLADELAAVLGVV